MFCPKCGSILLPKREGSKMVIKCSCGYKSNNAGSTVIREEVIDKGRSVELVDSEADMKSLPKLNVECPKCHHHEAGYWEVQTRAADEPATKFYKCIKCKNVWRDYS